MDGREHDFGPEQAPVLAASPVFGFIGALLAGLLNFPFGFAFLLVGFGKRNPQVLPDGLFFLEAFDALGSRIPGGDDALGILGEP